MAPGCAAFWVPDQNAPARGFLAQARSAARAATAARRTPPEGLRATEVWIPDQTSGAQAPFFGGLLGPAVRSAAKAATPPQFALRARGQCPLPVCPSPASLVRQSGRALCSGVLRRGLGRVRGPVWAKNRSGRALTCVSLPPSQRRAPFRGIHKGASPLCALLVPFRASEKGPAARGRIPRILRR